MSGPLASCSRRRDHPRPGSHGRLRVDGRARPPGHLTRPTSEEDDRAQATYRGHRTDRVTRSSRPVWLGEDQRGWDHFRVHIQLLRDERVGIFELAVYCGLAAHGDTGTGLSRPSNATLAKYFGCSERRVVTAKRNLERAGYIETEERPGMASVYRLKPPPPLHEMQGSDDATPARDDRDPCTSEREPLHVVHPNEKENEKTTNDSAERAIERFESSLVDVPGLPAVVAGSATLADVVSLCERFGAQLAARGYDVNGSARSKRWLVDMDAIVRIDRREPVAVRRVLDWLDAGADPVSSFWRTNVRSPGTLRARWQVMAEQFHREKAGPKKPRGETFGQDRADVERIMAEARRPSPVEVREIAP